MGHLGLARAGVWSVMGPPPQPGGRTSAVATNGQTEWKPPSNETVNSPPA